MSFINNLSDFLKIRYVRVIGGSIIAAVLLFFIGANYLMNTPSFCDRCHELKPSFATWHKSSHEKIACNNCHFSTKDQNFMTRTMRLANYVYLHSSGQYDTTLHVDGGIRNAVCMKCHVSWRNVTAGGDVVVPHNKHFTKFNVECNMCHARVVHGWTRAGKFKTNPSMQICMRCHDGAVHEDINEGKAVPKLACRKCHTEKAIPDDHREADWLALHSQKASTSPDYCKKCHAWTPDFCRECHTARRPSTHIGGLEWRTLHNTRALARKDNCLVCHNKNFCLRCHDDGLWEILK